MKCFTELLAVASSHFYPLKLHPLSLDLSPGVHAWCAQVWSVTNHIPFTLPNLGMEKNLGSALMNLTHQWPLHNDMSGYCTWNEFIVQRKCEATRSGTELLRILSLHIIITYNYSICIRTSIVKSCFSQRCSVLIKWCPCIFCSDVTVRSCTSWYRKGLIIVVFTSAFSFSWLCVHLWSLLLKCKHGTDWVWLVDDLDGLGCMPSPAASLPIQVVSSVADSGNQIRSDIMSMKVHAPSLVLFLLHT